MEKRYFTALDFDKMVYFQMPKVLMYGEKYEKLSNDAKILYMYCFDLIKISMSNHGRKDKHGNIQNWKDENGFYIKLSLEKIQQIVKCGKGKAVSLKKELEKYGLLEQQRVGLKQANLLYVLQLEYTEEDIYRVNEELEELLNEPEKEPLKPSGSNEVRKSNFKKSENQTSGSPKIELQEVRKSDPNNNKSINTKTSNNKLIEKQTNSLKEEEEEKLNNNNLKIEVGNELAAGNEMDFSTGFEEKAIISDNVMFMVLKDVLVEHGVNTNTVGKIIRECKNRQLTAFRIKDVTAQLEHMHSRLKNNETIFDFAVYFANGLEERTRNSEFELSASLILEQLNEHLQNPSTPQVTFYNWLEERE